MIETAQMTLTDFLLARIAEDEATAEGASLHVDAKTGSPLAWLQGGAWHNMTAYNEAGKTVADATTPEEAEHVVRHGPRRVMAECKAKRNILALHGPAESRSRDRCARCRAIESDAPQNLWPCETVRALALPYADHPDYRDEWRA